MSEFFRQLFAQLAAIWQKLSLQQKIITSSLVFFSIVGLVGLLVWAQSGTSKTADSGYRVLYSNLELEESGAITEELQKMKYDYKLEAGGRTITVPAKQLYEVRIALAREGLPKSRGLGYEVFDKNNFGMTDFVQKMNARRALEGELQRTIEGLDEVKQARVHIVIPEPTIFLDQQKESKASVVIQFKPSRQIGREQIRGISYLISSSVDGLKPEHVSIVDYDGRLLSSPFSQEPTALVGSHNMELQQNIERHLENKVTGMLTGILGPSKAYVKVAADLDFDRVERTMEQYDPESKVIRSEERIDETTKNAPDGDHQKERSLTNYEIDKTVQNIIQEVGNIKRLTISVAVDGKYATDKEGTTTYAARTAEEMADIEDIVKNAVGYDLARGDQIAVSQVQFNNEFIETERKSFLSRDRREFWLMIAKYAIGALIALLLILFLRYLAKTIVEAMNPPVPVMEQLGVIEEVPKEVPEEVRKSSEILERVEIMTREEPVNISAIIRQWLAEPAIAHKKKR
ncbi:MAG: flagellar M-ring protein FliF [Chitinispirillaceae bacterium]|nr:flagellar M-ring protein FliF [Chitinispirillaceae bacterium]